MSSQRVNNNYSLHNKVRIVRGGADYFRLVEEIAGKATYSLHLQTYIFDEDETGSKIAEALMEASGRGVLVYVLLDGYASQHLSIAFKGRLKEAGVQFGFFEPVLKSRHFYMGRRLHHKLVVADGFYSLVAGINISNRYNDIGAATAWLDWAVYAEGDIAAQLNDVCVRTWNRSLLRKKCNAVSNPRHTAPGSECLVRVRINDWVYRRTQITKNYQEIFRTAKHEVTLMTSYFWPPGKLLAQMGKASARGVKVKLILTARADVPFAKYSERYLYRWLFRHNIEVFEYQQNILHGKIAVCDKARITVGSYNVNNISAFASVELNLDIKDTAIATKVSGQFDTIMANGCVQIDSASFWTSISLVRRLLYYCSYKLVHFMFFLFTFYFVQQRENN
jgi:cardiolipin synthase A/B